MTERWDQIAPRWITAQRRLLAAPDTTPRHHAVLAAVLYQTAARQSFTDRTSLGQIARNAGIWTEDGPCSRHRKRLTGQVLAHLDSHGVIIYEALPGPAGCIVTLPEPDAALLTEAQARAFQERASDDGARAFQERASDDGARASQGARERDGGSRVNGSRSRVNPGDMRSDRAESAHRSRVPGTRASEGSSEGSTRGRIRGEGGPSHGPAEGGPTTTTPSEGEAGVRKRAAARRAIHEGTTPDPLHAAFNALIRDDHHDIDDEGYLFDLGDAVWKITAGMTHDGEMIEGWRITEHVTGIALDALDRADHGTHPLQAAHQAAHTWAAHPARDRTDALPRPPKDRRP